jgi:hypothetical protein
MNNKIVELLSRSTLRAIIPILTAVSMKMTRATALMLEAVRTSETPVNFYQTTWRNILEDSHIDVKGIQNSKIK